MNAIKLIGQQNRIRMEDVVKSHARTLNSHNRGILALIKIVGENPDLFKDSDSKRELLNEYEQVTKLEQKIEEEKKKAEEAMKKDKEPGNVVK